MIGQVNLNLEIAGMNEVVNLDSFIAEYLKCRKFERSRKLLSKAIPETNSDKMTSRTLEKFKKYLMKKYLMKSKCKRIVKQENDDLGFEINFSAGPTSVKVTVIFLISNQF